MAVITPTKQIVGGGAALLVTWANLANGDSGAPVDLVEFADRSVQVVGTFGTGGSVSLEGSLDASNFASLTDPQGNALAITTAKIEAVSELTYQVRPRVTAGDGTTSLTVSLLLRRNI